jgi:hypothetical protein
MLAIHHILQCVPSLLEVPSVGLLSLVFGAACGAALPTELTCLQHGLHVVQQRGGQNQDVLL